MKKTLIPSFSYLTYDSEWNGLEIDINEDDNHSRPDNKLINFSKPNVESNQLFILDQNVPFYIQTLEDNSCEFKRIGFIINKKNQKIQIFFEYPYMNDSKMDDPLVDAIVKKKYEYFLSPFFGKCPIRLNMVID